jgi:hypothetical protein
MFLMRLVCLVAGLEVSLFLDSFSGGSHMDEKGLMHTVMPDRNSEFCTFDNLCLELVILERGKFLLNTVLLGDIWNQRAFM